MGGKGGVAFAFCLEPPLSQSLSLPPFERNTETIENYGWRDIGTSANKIVPRLPTFLGRNLGPIRLHPGLWKSGGESYRWIDETNCCNILSWRSIRLLGAVPLALRLLNGAVSTSSTTALLVRRFSPECEPQNIAAYDKKDSAAYSQALTPL
nr:uncharacterized protein LOC111382179 [Ipomoea batatas]